MTLRSEFFAFIITDDNKEELTREFNSKDVMPAVHSQSPETFEPGCIAVIRLISADDPFSDSLGNRLYSVWIATQEQFDDKFVITGKNQFYDHRLELRLK